MMKNNPDTLARIEEMTPRLETALMRYMFDTNDADLRSEVHETFTELLTREGADFAIVCDESNNTVDRINNNELWVDLAVRFNDDEVYVFVPMRLTRGGYND